MMSSLIYVISGPSGTGKSTIIDGLRKLIPDLAYSVSHTSRKPRGEERDGVDYFFVEREDFERLIRKGDFLEWAEVYGDYYGTSFSSLKGQVELGLDVIMDVDIQGAKNIKASFDESLLIYILPPSLEMLEKRLRGRGSDSEKAIKNRIEKAFKELTNCVWFDYIIFNDDLDQAVNEAASIVNSEKCRKARQFSKVQRIFQISEP